MNTYQVIHHTAEDFARLVKFDADIPLGLFVIGGNNKNGKTSSVETLLYNLYGGKLPPFPVRKGASEARLSTVIDTPTGKLTVKRTIKPDGKVTATITNEDGMSSSPKTLLDSMLGDASADPLEFTRLTPKAMVEEVKRTFGLDTSDLDQEESEAFSARTLQNSRVRDIKGKADLFTPRREELDAAPDEALSISALTAELQLVHEHNKEGDRLKNIAVTAGYKAREAARRIEDAQKAITDLEAELTRAKETLASQIEDEKPIGAAANEADAAAEGFGFKDTEGLSSKIADAETINERVRTKQQRATLRKEHAEAVKAADDLTARIDAARLAKKKRIEALKMPVEGLAFEDDEAGALTLMYNDLPFERASSAEQLCVSVPMAFAANRKLKFAYIKDGSLLDDESLALVAKLTAECGAQLIMERVGHGSECDVILVDGESIIPEKATV
jgi:hypothetical protein